MNIRLGTWVLLLWGALSCTPARAADPVVSSATAVSDPLEAKVTVRVKNAPLAAYLDSIASQTQINFILADGLDGVRVTAFLSDVTAREALELLRLTKGLTYRSVGSATMIAPASRRLPKKRAKVHPLQHAGPGSP